MGFRILISLQEFYRSQILKAGMDDAGFHIFSAPPNLSSRSKLFHILISLACLPVANCFTQNRFFSQNANVVPRPVRWGPLEKRDIGSPLVINNNCPDTIWPAIGTQAGTGPGIGGFELAPGNTMSLTVSQDWQGRVWGRTNCSFNAAGTGASNLNGNNGAGAACFTGDCGGMLNCVNGVSTSSLK